MLKIGDPAAEPFGADRGRFTFPPGGVSLIAPLIAFGASTFELLK